MTQPGLKFGRDTLDHAAILEPYVMQWLSDGEWHTARNFRTFGNVEIRIAGIDRTLRTIADRSEGQIISGQKGYKLTKFATTEEIDHAERWLLSQARKMTERAVEIRKARNGRAA